MGPVPVFPSYEFNPGSRLPPKKVFVLQGTRGYEVDQVVCVEESSLCQENRGAKEKLNTECQRAERIDGSESGGNSKGKGVRYELNTERENVRREEREFNECLLVASNTRDQKYPSPVRGQI